MKLNQISSTLIHSWYSYSNELDYFRCFSELYKWSFQYH